jgi:hypothetical protein
MNGWAKLDTLGHPMSNQAKLTMTFRRPDYGHIEFKWVLDDPKTYTRSISNERVFVLTPNVELMEYSCMEGNLTSLLEGAVTPWTGPKENEHNVVYPADKDWPAYDSSRLQKLSGTIREAVWEPHGMIQIEVNGKLASVILAPPARMDFRGLSKPALVSGVQVTVEAYPHRQKADEFRAITITIGNRTTELR